MLNALSVVPVSPPKLTAKIHVARREQFQPEEAPSGLVGIQPIFVDLDGLNDSAFQNAHVNG